MSAHYLNLLFTEGARAAQTAAGSRKTYARADDAPDQPDLLGMRELEFIAARDTLYMATVGKDGWPYLQHRGGPPGFVKALSGRRLGFADFRGNRQFISLGNLALDGRVSLFFMDYVNRARLKLIGRMRPVSLADAPDLQAALVDEDYGAVVERGLVIDIEAFDWNCPQHITPRYTLAELEPALDTLKGRIAELERLLAESGVSITPKT